MADTPIEVCLIYEDGSIFFVGRFACRQEAEAWVETEKARRYWKPKTRVIYVDVHPLNGRGL